MDQTLLPQNNQDKNKNTDNFLSASSNRSAASSIFPANPPLKSDDNSVKLAMGTIMIILFFAAVIGGYYFYVRNDESNILVQPEPVLSPTSEVSPVESLMPVPTIVSAIDKNLDTDGDDLPDEVEKVINTDINNSDSDSDAFSDLNEIKSGYNPLVAGEAGKYTAEELQILENNIKAVDEEFYMKEFGLQNISEQSPILSPEVSLTPIPVISPLISPIVTPVLFAPEQSPILSPEVSLTPIPVISLEPI